MLKGYKEEVEMRTPNSFFRGAMVKMLSVVGLGIAKDYDNQINSLREKRASLLAQNETLDEKIAALRHDKNNLNSLLNYYKKAYHKAKEDLDAADELLSGLAAIQMGAAPSFSVVEPPKGVKTAKAAKNANEAKKAVGAPMGPRGPYDKSDKTRIEKMVPEQTRTIKKTGTTYVVGAYPGHFWVSNDKLAS